MTHPSDTTKKFRDLRMKNGHTVEEWRAMTDTPETLRAQCLRFHNREPMALCRDAVDEHGRQPCVICAGADAIQKLQEALSAASQRADAAEQERDKLRAWYEACVCAPETLANHLAAVETLRQERDRYENAQCITCGAHLDQVDPPRVGGIEPVAVTVRGDLPPISQALLDEDARLQRENAQRKERAMPSEPAPATTEKLQPIRCAASLDWCDYTCPCGATHQDRDGWAPSTLKPWLREHATHCNGTVLMQVTARGQRIFAQPQPDEVLPLDRLIAEKES